MLETGSRRLMHPADEVKSISPADDDDDEEEEEEEEKETTK